MEFADVVSEGAVRCEPDGLTYYGSASLLWSLSSRGGCTPDGDAQRVARALSADPHARMRALRMARHEAQLRSAGRLTQVYAEVLVRRITTGIRLDIELEARLPPPESPLELRYNGSEWWPTRSRKGRH